MWQFSNGSPFWIWKTHTFISLSIPPTGSTFGSATRAWCGNLSSSIWFTHCTTSVYNGNGTCHVLSLSQWAQLTRQSRRLAVKSYIGGVCQTANPMVIESLHMPRMGGKHGEVKLDSSGVQLLGNFARYKSRYCPAMATTLGASSFPRETSSLRLVAYPTHSVPTLLKSETTLWSRSTWIKGPGIPFFGG